MPRRARRVTELSRRLVDANRAREYLDITGDDSVEIPADVIRELLVSPPAALDPFGLRIVGATITGQLDLEAVTVPFPLIFDRCSFTDAPRVEGAHLHEIQLLRSHVPGLLANGVRIDRDLDLSGSTITGALTTRSSNSASAAVWITEANIGGRLLCVGTTIETDAPRAIQADHSTFGGSVRFLRGFTSNSEIRLLAIHTRGSVDFAGATIRTKTARAVDLSEARVDGTLFVVEDVDGRPTEMQGRFELRHARIGGMWFFRSATIHAPEASIGERYYMPSDLPDRTAVLATRCVVNGDFVVDADSVIDGALVLTMATITGEVRIDRQHLVNPGGIALDLSRADIAGSLRVRPSRIKGRVKLTSATVGGSVTMQHTHISDAPSDGDDTEGWAQPVIGIAGQGLTVAKDFDAAGLHTDGCEVWLRSARIGAEVDMRGAQLSNPSSYALSMHMAHIGGALRLGGGFSSNGLVAINNTTVEGRTLITGATMKWDGPGDPRYNHAGAAFEAIGSMFNGGIVLDWDVVGQIDLTNTATTFVADDPTRWGTSVQLTGFRYNRFADIKSSSSPTGDWNRERRIAWLDNHSQFDPGPYEQLASVYRSHGRRRDADKISMHGIRRGHDADKHRVSHRNRIVRWLYHLLAGSGYRPERAIYVLVGLIGLVGVTATLAYHHDDLRATDNLGTIYTADGPLPEAATPLEVVAPPSGDVALHTERRECGAGAVLCFQPVLFALDTVVPIINLHQRDDWRPVDTGYQIWFNTATALGWALSTVAALSFTKLNRTPS